MLSHKDILDAIERRIDELRRLQKATTATSLPLAANKCPYCSAAFDSWLDFSRHLKTCGEFRKQVKVDPYDSDSPVYGQDVRQKRVGRGSDSSRDQRRARKWSAALLLADKRSIPLVSSSRF
jgi:hypothetical protein